MNELPKSHPPLHRRFDRFGRLVGDAKMRKLMSSHVMIIGLGGVGSWAAEAIARSGIGRITLVDFDEICITNFNRQLHALEGERGKQKSLVMERRLQQINPQARIQALPAFYDADRCPEIFAEKPDFVIDAIDHVTSKCHLLHYCRSGSIPIVTSTGSGGRMDPTCIKVADLSATEVDPLAKALRRILREKYAFPGEGKGEFGITAVYSTERASDPVELPYDNGKGFTCVCPRGGNEMFSCSQRNVILGTASFVTGAFGLTAASVCVRRLMEQ